MKITMTAAGGRAMVLADDSNGATIADGFRPAQTRTVQKQPLFRAAFQANLPRYNLENRLTFTVEKVFATRKLALNFLATYPSLVPVQGTVTLTDSSQGGSVNTKLANAVVERIECVEHVGVSCKLQFVIAGNGAWQ